MKKLIISSIFVLLAGFIFAQNGQIKGKITDASNNEPIPFANVLVVGTQTGAVSDLDGKFIITGLNPGYVNLKVSFVGYKTKITSDIMLPSPLIILRKKTRHHFQCKALALNKLMEIRGVIEIFQE